MAGPILNFFCTHVYDGLIAQKTKFGGATYIFYDFTYFYALIAPIKIVLLKHCYILCGNGITNP